MSPSAVIYNKIDISIVIVVFDIFDDPVVFFDVINAVTVCVVAVGVVMKVVDVVAFCESPFSRTAFFVAKTASQCIDNAPVLLILFRSLAEVA